MKRILFISAVLALWGCGSNAPAGVDCVANPSDPACQTDAGAPDAGPADAGARDAGVDAGAPDAGPPDAGCGAEFAACDGGICEAGVCVSACAVGTSVVTKGTANPVNPCETCQPGVSTSSYSPLVDGTSCNADGQHFCSSDVCVFGCDIPNVGVVDAGSVQAVNDCLTCQPAVSPVAYSNAPNGIACATGGGNVCFGGTCSAGCIIDGGYHASGENNGPCQTCNPSKSTSAWTVAADGTQCGCAGPTGSQIVTARCSAGACQVCPVCPGAQGPGGPCCGGCNPLGQCFNPPACQ